MAGIRITNAVQHLYNKLKAVPGATGSGIAAQKRGYHNSRQNNPSYDYSVTLPLDKQGPYDAAAAIDITCSTKDMIMYTKRAMAALKAGDPRFRSVREFIGTTNGSSVVRYSRTSRTGTPQWLSSDSSHLWHYHISLFRADLENEDSLMGIYEVLTGNTAGSFGGEGIFEMLGLKRGDSGSQVKLLQTLLNGAGFSVGTIDGDYGPKTASAVLAMRKSRGSGVKDGNNMTAWAVQQLLEATAVASSGVGSSHSHSEYALKNHGHSEYDHPESLPGFGDKGRTVQYWQRILAEVGHEVPRTSEYDEATRDAVKAWYKKASGGNDWHGNYISPWIGLNLQKEALSSKVDLGTLKISGTVTAETE